MVGGERMTVTAVFSSTSPQSIGVTRSVNGVVKTHPSGSKVELFRPCSTRSRGAESRNEGSRLAQPVSGGL
jgi:hypothetical protein